MSDKWALVGKTYKGNGDRTLRYEHGDMAIELRNLKTPNKELICKQDAIDILKIWEDNYYWDESCRSGELEDITSPHSMIEKLNPYGGEENV